MTKVPDHIRFVPRQSTDKIGDLSIDKSPILPVDCFEYTYMMESQLVYISLQRGSKTIDGAEQ